MSADGGPKRIRIEEDARMKFFPLKESDSLFLHAYAQRSAETTPERIAAERKGGIPWLLILMLTIFPPQRKQRNTKSAPAVREILAVDFASSLAVPSVIKSSAQVVEIVSSYTEGTPTVKDQWAMC